ncbi:hypothetical protein ACHWQZ_G001273 [Mnemiopsis leidyi]
MDNVILWIKSNKDVVDAYKRTKVDCNYHNKSDNDFLMFLLEAATNVLSIVHQFSPQITKSEDQNETVESGGNSETIVTKDDEINLEKLDKQLRINIVCPDLENTAPAKQQNLADPETGLTDSTSALKDISDHVNELESVLESLNKSCPSPLTAATIFRPLSSRTFLESLKPPICAPKITEVSGNFVSSYETPPKLSKPIEPNFVKPTESSFTKFKSSSLPLLNKRAMNNSIRPNASVRSSPNVTISAESLLNLAKDKERENSKNLTIIKPIPMMLKSPDKERTPSPVIEPDPQIDVVNPDQEMTEKCPTPEPDPVKPNQRQGSISPSERNIQSGGIKRKAECLDNTGPEDNGKCEESPPREEPNEQDQRSMSPADVGEQSPQHLHQHPVDLANLPSDSELTQQLMSVIQSTIAQTSSITCNDCGLIFANEVNLHRHMLTHLDSENKEQYNCPTCAFKTPRRQTLAKHITTVHSRDRSSGILYCDQCEYKTPTKSHLRNHMLAHSGNRQYQCPHCTYNSNFSNALTRHMTMHSREMFESKVNSSKSS